MSVIDGRSFWLKVDSLIAGKGMSLGEFCAKANVSYNTDSYQRTRHALPKVEQLFSMADVLKLSVEELITGKSSIDISPEAKAVNESEELKALVRAVMRDPQRSTASSGYIRCCEEQREDTRTGSVIYIIRGN